MRHLVYSVRYSVVKSGWNVMAHGDAREGKWRENWRMAWVASTRHTTSEHGVSSITTADALTSVASSRLNWRLCRFKWTRPFRRKTKSDFCACAITFQTQSTNSFLTVNRYIVLLGYNNILHNAKKILIYLHDVATEFDRIWFCFCVAPGIW
jgi:hypothetical protein